jgi:hypothetical protein
MKAGYAALFGVVVAFSAYQGTTRQSPLEATVRPKTSSESMSFPAGPDSNLPGVQKFPTIAGGMCKLTLDVKANPPCGGCQSICPGTELAHLMGDYFTADTVSDPVHWNVSELGRSMIRFVIASVPDPVHTHMALLFDRGIETIQSAAQASGFLFDRSWMPWDISSHSESADFTVRMAQDKYQESVEDLPGLMIFQKTHRKTEATSEVLFVLVVGETPTGGIHLEQLKNAFSIRRSMLDGLVDRSGERNILRFYGPEFSGSLRSLNDGLNAVPDHNNLKVFIRSGSISSTAAIQHFRFVSKNICAKCIDFKTFQFPDSEQEYYLSLFLGDREHLHSHIAILSEDETAFGSQELQAKEESGGTLDTKTSAISVGNSTPDGHNSDVSQKREAGGLLNRVHHFFSWLVGSEVEDLRCKARPPKDADADAPSPCFPYLRLYFPRGIAQLRDAYQRNVKAQAAPVEGLKSIPQDTLPLSLSITGTDEDSVAPYSPLQTPLSEESILQGIVSALRKKHARVVVIRAADPLDMIFLSRYLRQNYPQARLITIGADLLMVHEFYDPRFHGILALAPYPLLSGVSFPEKSAPADAGYGQSNQADDVAHQVERVFPDSYTVGSFNAMLSLLMVSKQTTVSDPNGLPPSDYVQFGLPSFLLPKDADTHWQPHLWLLTIGNDGYWPAAVLDYKDQFPSAEIPYSDTGLVSHPSYFVHFSIEWTLLWILVFSLTLAFALLLALPAPFRRSEVLSRFRVTESPVRNGILFAGGMLLVAAQSIFVFPSIPWLGRFHQLDKSISFSQWVSDFLDSMWPPVLGYGLSVGLLGFACYVGFRKRKSKNLAYVGAALCGGSLAAACLSTIWDWSRYLSPVFGAFVYRFVHVESGVSPALPVLLLLGAWIWWCWQSLTGVASTEEKDIVMPSPDKFSATVLSDAYDRVRLEAIASRSDKWPPDSMHPISCDMRIVLAAILGTGGILLLMRPGEIAEAFEPTPFKLLYWILLYSCLCLVCYLAAQIVGLWLEFRTLLRAIHQLPFRRTFKDLKPLTWKPLWKLAGAGREEFIQLFGEEIDALDEIQKIEVKDSPLAIATAKAKDAILQVCEDYERMTTAADLRMFDFRVCFCWFTNTLRHITWNKTVRGIKDWYSSNVAIAGSATVRNSFHDLQVDLASVTSQALIQLASNWKTEERANDQVKPQSSDEAKPESRDENPGPKNVPLNPKTPSKETRALERFLCLFYLNVILVPLRRLQTIILALAGVFVFVLMSYSSYPFESRESFHVLLISIFFAISLVVGIVYGQMYSNSLLSVITNTAQGELGVDFWVKLGSFVFIPLLSILSVQFPGLNNFLFSWLQPALQSVK